MKETERGSDGQGSTGSALDDARDALVKACLKYESELREMLLAKWASHPVTYCIFAYRRVLNGEKVKEYETINKE